MEPQPPIAIAVDVLDSMPDAVFALDEHWRFTFSNGRAELVLGRLHEEISGRTIWEEFPGLEATELGVRLRQVAEGREPVCFETIFSPRDLWVYARIFPCGNGVSVAFQDIGERRKIEDERSRVLAEIEAARLRLDEIGRMKDSFLAMLSHELRTPLGAVVGWIQLLRDGRLDEAGQRNALDIIERNTRAQAQLIKDMLDVSRISRGVMRLQPRMVELRPLIEAAVATAAPAADAKEITIACALAPDVVVYGDPDRLVQLAWCLVSNAVKFTPRGGRVDVALRQEDGRALLAVADTGCGIGAEFLPHVFERFSQADLSLARQHRGLGLGLALAKGLAELHGGAIEASSPGIDQGTTFTVALPVRQARESVKAAPVVAPDRPADPSRSRLAGIRVLLVDDDADTCESMAMVLSEYGAEAKVCGSARVALEALTAWNPDVLLADIGMPDVTGYDLIRAVRAMPEERGGRVPAAAVTAHGSVEDRIRALEAGFQVHLPKPVEPAELVAIVSSLATRARRAGA